MFSVLPRSGAGAGVSLRSIHPIWGHFALVSVGCRLSIYRAGHYFPECQSQRRTFVCWYYVCVYQYVIVLGLLKMLRNPGPHAVLTRIFQKLMHAGERICQRRDNHLQVNVKDSYEYPNDN